MNDDLNVYALLLLVLLGIGSCSIYSANRVDAVIASMIAEGVEVRR